MNFVDVAGATLLAQEAQRRRAAGGCLYLHGLRQPAEELMRRGGMFAHIGEGQVFRTKDQAIATIFERLDRDICARCTARIFYECQAEPSPAAKSEGAGNQRDSQPVAPARHDQAG
jgi:SulP family sulfate permease